MLKAISVIAINSHFYSHLCSWAKFNACKSAEIVKKKKEVFFAYNVKSYRKSIDQPFESIDFKRILKEGKRIIKSSDNHPVVTQNHPILSDESVLIRFFPGLRLTAARQVGRVVFWSFPDKIDDYLPDWARDRAGQFAEFFKDNHGEPLANLVCATVQEPGEAEDLAMLNQEISYAADILCYAEQASAYGSGSTRKDHFESHPFNIPRDAVVDVVAFYGLGHTTIVGLGANFNYYLPPFLSQEMLRVSQDEPLLGALAVSLERWRQAEAGALQKAEVAEDRRLLRAVGWYNQSGFRYSSHSIETLVLHAATALEALLDLPRGGTTEAFRNAVALLLGDNAELRRWCTGFYDTRSRIIHGDETPDLLHGVSGQRPHLSHLDFARAVFEQCMIAILVNRGRLPYDPFVIGAIRHMNINTRLISNQQRLQEIAGMEVEDVISDPATAERFRGALVYIDHYETNSVTQEPCDAAIAKVCQIIERICKGIETEAFNDEITAFAHSLRELIASNSFGGNSLLDALHDTDALKRKLINEHGYCFIVSRLSLLWPVINGLRSIVDVREAVSRRGY